MKKNGWISCGFAVLVLTGTALADGQLETLVPASPEPAKPTQAVAAPAAKTELPVFLSPGAATITGNNVNVRGKAGFRGEVIAKLNKGDAVTVIEQVILSKTRRNEPAQWAKIAYPGTANVWVHNNYLTPEHTVKPKRLNIRTGPGENYSRVGILEQGATVTQVSVKGNWTEIAPPPQAYAFVAAAYVQQDASVVTPHEVVSIQPPEAAPEAAPATVDEGPMVAANTTDVEPAEPLIEPAPMPIDDAPDAPAPPPIIEEVWVPRTVSHEGIVKPTISIQAPTKFGLHSTENGKLINYLYSPTAQLEMSRYENRHIIVTGQEGLDERWMNTPVLTIQKIYVVE